MIAHFKLSSEARKFIVLAKHGDLKVTAHYILRADDACSTMDEGRWQKFEDLCRNYDIHPLIAVVPENKDPHLQITQADLFFWDKVRSWQSLGWDIGLHGFTHQLFACGVRHLVPINKYGEFPGLPHHEQKQRLVSGLKKFADQGINCRFFIPPAHALDMNTCRALRDLNCGMCISDGFAFDSFYHLGLFWLPQQLWRFKVKSDGIWTICIHPNDTLDAEFDELERCLQKHASQFIAASQVVLNMRPRTWRERAYGWQHYIRRRIWELRVSMTSYL